MSESTLNISELTIEQRALLERRLRQKREGSRLADRIVPRGDESPAPLSFAQQRLWFLHQLDPDSPLYNCASAVRLDGELNVPALEGAVGEIVARHETLRTTFQTQVSETLQFVAPAAPVSLPVLDLSALAEAERETEAMRVVTEEARRPFDLTRGPLLRLTLLRLGPRRHVLGLTLHHIIADGWSMGVLVRELSALYGAYAQGSPSPLAPLAVQYADYARWQRDWLSGERLEAELSYWRRHLEGAPAALELPADRARAGAGAYSGGRHRVEVSAEVANGLKALARREGATLFMALLAAWRVLLWRHSGEPDVVVGTPVAGRQRAEVEGLIGFFVNTLAVRVRAREGEDFRALLRREREACLGAFEHQGVAFERVVEALRPERSLSHTPVFQAVFALQNSPAPFINLPGLTVSQQELAANISKFDIALTLTEQAQRLDGFIEYSTELFDASTVERLAARFLTLLEGIVADPGRRVEELPLLPAAERRLLLRDWNDTAAPYPKDCFVHQMFEAHAARDPDALALVAGDVRLTYGELNARANRLAHYLRGRGVGPDVLVGLCVERSAEWVTGWLGVLKAGGAPVSIDPTYPPARIALMVEDARVRLLLTARRGALAVGDGCEVLRLDSDWERVARESERNPESGVSGQNLAYVIYTSGSTGKPKGVAATHGSLVNLVTWHTRLYEVTPADRAAQIARMAFDASVLEMWPIFWAGASLHLIDEETRLSPQGIREWLVANEITFCHLPPALSEPILFDEWPAQTRLRMMLTGSDRLRQHPPASLPFGYANHYGPTETTVLVTSCRVPPREEADGAPTIGRPLANTQVYLLDRRLQLVPVGVPGELYAGGDGITRGYLNDPKLTAEKFVPDPFSTTPGARLYRTGDVARHLDDGRIEFLGRGDTQVKIRGHRIELGEVETALAAHPAVERAIVEVREAAGGDRRLVAYVLCGEEVAWEETREQLRALAALRLPDYMVPAAYTRLDALPLTTNGKIDRRALPEPDWTQTPTGAEFVPPRNDLERQLAGMFSELLGVGDVGVHHNFFELGGHSLLATQFTARARAACGVELPLRSFFEAPTVAGVAAYIERHGPPASDFGVPEIKAAARGDKSLDELLAELDAMSGEEARALLSDGEPSAQDASRG